MIFLVETVPNPDGYFWYGLSSALAGCIIYILWRYVGKTEKAIEKLTDCVSRLVTKTELHEQRLDYIDEKLSK